MSEPAFPFVCQGPTTAPEVYYGMSLRDYFAAKALTGLLANPNSQFGLDAADCYSWADAMLKEREK